MTPTPTPVPVPTPELNVLRKKPEEAIGEVIESAEKMYWDVYYQLEFARTSYSKTPSQQIAQALQTLEGQKAAAFEYLTYLKRYGTNSKKA